jgi:hypothetical protein
MLGTERNTSNGLISYNRLADNFHLTSKKALFLNMKTYSEAMGEDPFNQIPVTYHIKHGLEDCEYEKFKTYYEEMPRTDERGRKVKNIWIVKPGENSNRGNGIFVTKDLDEITKFLGENTKEASTTILQKYIEYPLLINKRKFDLRLFTLVTSGNQVKAYFYREGYLRTSCKEFTTQNLNRMIHLTNDAVQK